MDYLIKELEQKVSEALAALKDEISTIRSNRPSPALIEDLKINYFDTPTPLKQLGSISVVPPREIVITLWDPSSAQQVAKAIEETKRGFNPAVNGPSVHISLPPLTQETRDELVRQTKAIVEKSRIQLRNIRDEINKKLNSADLSEDIQFKGKKKIQEAVDKGNKEIEDILNNKVKEINE